MNRHIIAPNRQLSITSILLAKKKEKKKRKEVLFAGIPTHHYICGCKYFVYLLLG